MNIPERKLCSCFRHLLALYLLKNVEHGIRHDGANTHEVCIY